jgi:hypothetical protein
MSLSKNKTGDDGNNVLGFDAQWGDDPFGKPKPAGAFSPQYFTLVVIRIRTDLKIDAAHASYALPSGDTDQYVLSLLSSFNLDPAKPIILPPNPYPNSSGTDLIDLGFGSERKVYFYVVNPSLSFVPGRGMRFTQFDASGAPRDKNKTFYNARTIATGSAGNPPQSSAKGDSTTRAIATGAALGSLLYAENYYRDQNGGPNGSKDRYYSINLMLNMATPGGGSIPIIIDPGTGNGGNWRP